MLYLSKGHQPPFLFKSGQISTVGNRQAITNIYLTFQDEMIQIIHQDIF